MFKETKYFLAATALLGLAMTGCSKSDGSNTNPNASALTPTGTVQGLLRDAVTQQPIVNAVIDIDGITATTNENGQYSLHNVPATTDALHQTVGTGTDGTYHVTVNLRSVTSPVRRENRGDGTVVCTDPVKKDTTGAALKVACYPDFAYDTVKVSYTSLNDTGSGNAGKDTNLGTPGGGSGSNHDTPVTGLAATMDVSVGKLAATISGVVAYGNTSICPNIADPVLAGTALQPVGAGFTVKLVSDCSNNSGGATGTTAPNGTGGCDNVVGSTTTDANGAFTFANIESLQDFRIDVTNSAGTYSGGFEGDGSHNHKFVTSPADGETLTLAIQQSTAAYVCTTDVHNPEVINVTPEMDSDLNPAGGVNVLFTFSEPIKQDVYATTLTDNGNGTGLYQDVFVNFDGPKAVGNLAHTLKWLPDACTTNCTQLQVSIPTLAPASVYTVDIDSTVGNLKDASDLTLVGSNFTDVSFSTNGAAAAAAPAISAVNAASMDNASGCNQPIIDWVATSGATSYNVYRSTDEVWGATRNAGAFAKINNVLNSAFTDGCLHFDEFGGSGPTVEYNYFVKAVNADGTESDASNTVNFKDSVGPAMVPFSLAILDTNGDGKCETIRVTFDERLDEASATTPANYTYNLGTTEAATLTPTAVTYNDSPRVVTLTVPETTCAQFTNDVDDSEKLTVTGVKDLAGNPIRANGDVYHQDTGLVD